WWHRRILDHPDGDGPRLAWAAVIEPDQPERAEFVRLQIRDHFLEAIRPPDPGPGRRGTEEREAWDAIGREQARIRARLDELYERDKQAEMAWDGTGGFLLEEDDHAVLAGWEEFVFRRGFLDAVAGRSATEHLERLDELLDYRP